MEQEGQLQKLKEQNSLLKKAVLQEQRRRTVAEEALGKSRAEGAALTARVEELSELLTSLSAGQHAGACADVAARSELQGQQTKASGWLNKNLGSMKTAGGAEGERMNKELYEELRVKAEEHECLHMRLFENGQELECLKEKLQESRAELGRARGSGDSSSSLHAEKHFSQDVELGIAAAERSADAVLATLDSALRFTSDFSVNAAALVQAAYETRLRGEGLPAIGESTDRIAETLKVTVPLLRQIMTGCHVHYSALGERLRRLQLLEGPRSPVDSHSRAARLLMEAAGQHHNRILALHNSAVCLRSALCACPVQLSMERGGGRGTGGGADTDCRHIQGAERTQVLAGRVKLAARGLAEAYETLRARWKEELDQESMWAERVSELEAFGPVGVPASLSLGALQQPRDHVQLVTANARLAQSYSGLAAAVSALDKALSAALAGIWGGQPAQGAEDIGGKNGRVNFADAVAALVKATTEWALALEAKMEEEQAAGLVLSPVGNDRMVKSAASICDLAASIHTRLVCGRWLAECSKRRMLFSFPFFIS